ncbi:MAG: hypothetical protein INR62_00240 [Rhodospirillales bacterium]|nr:hypothetical protein [Acetobacter sp.]
MNTVTLTIKLALQSRTPSCSSSTSKKLGIFSVSLIACVLTQGCSTTNSRFATKTTVLKELSLADRQLVLSGNIRRGMSKDAVYVAWGQPTRTETDNTPQKLREYWIYDRTYYGGGSGEFGVSRGIVHDENGEHRDKSNFYPTPDSAQTLGGMPSNTVPIMRVVFNNGRVIDYETAY